MTEKLPALQPPTPPLKQRKTFRRMKGNKVKINIKLEKFIEEFIRNGGNGTDAAMKTWNCKSRGVAAVMAHGAIKRAKQLGLVRTYLESQGYTYGKLLKLATKKLEEPGSKDFVPVWDRIMKMADYEDFISGKEKESATVVNIVQREKDLLKKYTEGEIVDEGQEK